MDPLRRRVLFLGGGAFLVALLVRLIGIGWGLPTEQRLHSLHPDEPVIWIYSQEIEPASFDFTPGFYNYGTFYLTLLRVATDVVGGYTGPTDNTPEAFWLSVGSYHVAGRVLSALAGAGTVWLVFLILLPRAGQFGALFGAAAMALAPGHVVHSRFQTVDVLATFLLVVSLYFALRLVPVGEDSASDRAYMKWSLWAGVFAGLSAGTKYTGVLALVALFVVVFMARRAVAWKSFGLACVVCVLVFLAVTPGALLESGKFMADFKYEMTHTQTGHGLVFAGTPSGYLFHLTNLAFALGLLMTVFGFVGLARASYRQHVWAFALFAFAAAYYILIGRAEVKFLRYVFPLIPVLCVGFGWLLSRAHASPKPAVKSLVMFFGILALGGLDGGGAAMTATTTSWMASTDVRDEIAAEFPDEASVGLATDPWFYTPPFYPYSATGPWVPIEQRLEWMRASQAPRMLRFVPEDASQRIDWDVRLLTEWRPDYVVFSSFELGDLDRINQLPSPPSEYSIQLGRAEEFMDTLTTQYERTKVRGTEGAQLPHDLMYIRPEVQVWKRKTDSSTPSNSSSTTSEPSGGRANTQ